MLSAATGFDVVLHEFFLASFINGGQTIQGFSVTGADTDAVLASQGSVLIPGASHFNFGFGAGSGVQAHRIRIVIDLTGLGGASDDIGIDNVRFGEVVAAPEAGTLSLLALAGLSALRRRRAQG